MRCRSDREKRLRYLEMEVWIMSKAAGGGIVYAPYVRNFYEGLRIKEAEGKIRLFHPLSDYYEDYLRSAPEREENPYQDFVPLPEAPIPEGLFCAPVRAAKQQLSCLAALPKKERIMHARSL